jgi:hypothetical protein
MRAYTVTTLLNNFDSAVATIAEFLHRLSLLHLGFEMSAVSTAPWVFDSA